MPPRGEGGAHLATASALSFSPIFFPLLLLLLLLANYRHRNSLLEAERRIGEKDGQESPSSSARTTEVCMYGTCSATSYPYSKIFPPIFLRSCSPCPQLCRFFKAIFFTCAYNCFAPEIRCFPPKLRSKKTSPTSPPFPHHRKLGGLPIESVIYLPQSVTRGELEDSGADRETL